MKPVGVAVVGAGYWGPNLVRNFRAPPEFDLAWVCDLSLERAVRVIGPRSTVRATDSLKDVLADPAVAVATPAATHADVVLACVDAGKHVLVEKPLAASVAEGEKLVLAAEQKHLVLMCDRTYCYTPAVRKVRELVHDGSLGMIHRFDLVRINLGLIQRDINVFWDLASHDLSILDFVLPPGCIPEAVAAQGLRVIKNLEAVPRSMKRRPRPSSWPRTRRSFPVGRPKCGAPSCTCHCHAAGSISGSGSSSTVGTCWPGIPSASSTSLDLTWARPRSASCGWRRSR